jgi:hypothetical protein
MIVLEQNESAMCVGERIVGHTTLPVNLRIAPSGSDLMKAAYLNETGAPSVIQFGEVPTPTPKAGEILVKVSALRRIE